ncbi:MAG: NADH-quinone oxidoreductase subunit I [Verrucomicrobia bacterium]|nr:MAG: NADH-quinone oxidoreductase subunit I [Verrucomicrobiota bacterium]
MVAQVKEVVGGFMSLLTGMGITLREFFKPTVTIHYPRQTAKIPERFRGHIQFKPDPETGTSTCIACQLCAKACPSDCIELDGEKKPGAKRKSVTWFHLDFTTCSLCGACIEVCPVDALEYSKAYNLASTDKQQFHLIDLVHQLEERQARKKAATPVAPPPADTASSSAESSSTQNEQPAGN